MESQTLSSSPDDRGNSYWVSFSNSSFAKGSTANVHKGILNGFGPRSGEKAIVKAFRDEPGTEDRCDVEMSKSNKAQELSILFNRKFTERSEVITFDKPMKALMDRVALMDVLSLSRRRLSGEEWILVEQNMGKRFRIYVQRNGDVSRTIHPALAAFVHFSYHHTGGELVVCGLKGIAHENGWTLKIPTIHSKDRVFGLSDCGNSGIDQVLQRHECNHICSGFDLPLGINRRQFGEPKLGRSSPLPMLRRQPSAPYNEVFSDILSPMVQGYFPSPPSYFHLNHSEENPLSENHSAPETIFKF